MDISIWAALAALFIAGGLTPGPAVMLVMSTSLRYRFGPAMIAALGVSAANLVWITLAAAGLGAFAAQFPQVLLILKIVASDSLPGSPGRLRPPIPRARAPGQKTRHRAGSSSCAASACRC